jgi:hypothetical protein
MPLGLARFRFLNSQVLHSHTSHMSSRASKQVAAPPPPPKPVVTTEEDGEAEAEAAVLVVDPAALEESRLANLYALFCWVDESEGVEYGEWSQSKSESERELWPKRARPEEIDWN